LGKFPVFLGKAMIPISSNDVGGLEISPVGENRAAEALGNTINF
jgi:hypothetical protein